MVSMIDLGSNADALSAYRSYLASEWIDTEIRYLLEAACWYIHPVRIDLCDYKTKSS